MLDQLECEVCPELANDCRDLLRRGVSGTEFDIALCRIICRNQPCISGYRWRPEPSKPYEYEKYCSLNKKDKAIYRDQHPTFLLQGRVAQYLDDMERISSLNRRNLDFLKLCFRLPNKNGTEQDGITMSERQILEDMLDTYSGKPMEG